MRYPASEKLEIIRIVEKSHLPVRQTLQKLGIPRATFYRWYDLYQLGGINALEDHRPLPGHVWNRVPDNVRREIVDLALEEPTLSPRELAVRFTDTKRYFVSESSVYRLLKAHDLITSPAFIITKAADEFKDKTTAPNQLWQTDFTYLKVTGWGWFYLSSILDDFSRYIIAWKLCTTMKATDVSDTLTMALDMCQDVMMRASCTSHACSATMAPVLHLWRNWPHWLSDKGMDHTRGAPMHPQTQGQDRAMASDTSKTASCSRTIFYRVVLKRGTLTSSATTTTSDTTKVSQISQLQMSILGGRKPS